LKSDLGFGMLDIREEDVEMCEVMKSRPTAAALISGRPEAVKRLRL
jgi:hypothetical protein